MKTNQAMNHDVTDFDTQVLGRSREVPVLCDFWAPWCGPCVMFGPLLEKVAADAGGRWELAKVNVEDHPEAADRFGITGIPAIKLFHMGAVIAESTGAMGEAELRAWLEANLPDAHSSTWSAVEQALSDLRFAEAEKMLEASDLPAGARRDLLLAKAIVWHDQRRAMSLAGEEPGEGVELGQWQAVVYLASLLADETLPKGETIHDHACETVLGLLREGNPAGAMELLETILLEKPGFRDGDAVRLQRALLQFLGIRHPLSERHYPAYSGAASLL